MKRNKSIKCIRLDGKDITKNNFDIDKDKCRYLGSLDYSLDILKLLEFKKTLIKDDKIDDIVQVTFNYKTDDMTTKEIRDKLYKDGFNINNKHYVRYKRTGGASRKGNCVFINETLYDKIMKWSYMGLKRNGEYKDLSGLETYLSLTFTSIIDTLQIQPNNILVIKDYESNKQGLFFILDEDDFSNFSFSEIRKKLYQIDDICQAKTGHGLDALIVDHIGLMKFNDNSNSSGKSEYSI